MRTTLTMLVALAALPAFAADLPPAPRADAPVEERLYLASTSADGPGLLAARVECVAFQRDRIDARLADGLLARGWNAEADRLWRLTEALARYEAAHIRPMMDRGTQDALLAAYFPEGVPGDHDDEARARRCLAFGNAWALRSVSG